ncbi:MAG TPA: TonB-dependent receptor plug domain-containing protein [Devosia sp.]
MTKHTHALLIATLTMPAVLLAQEAGVDAKKKEPILVLEKFVTDGAGDDPLGVLPTTPSGSAFGFGKTQLDTPRTMSVISSDIIDKMGLSAVEDLVRVVPGVYTLTRYGIQGNVDVRDVPADLFFRGMKRVNMEGYARTVLAAMDQIEIIKGPPSPIYGMGKIGGYTNMVPKSGRAKTGGYLEKPQGFAQGITGAYNRNEVSVGGGGPTSLMGKKGGYYVYGLLEDSDSFTDGVPVKTKMIQAAISLDRFIGPFRLDTGINAQSTRTAGSVLGRVTQDVIDTGRYIRGTPLINLDLNGNGSIGYLEYQKASPVKGNLSAGNTPLLQNFALPRDANGKPIPLNQMVVKPGIPQAMYDYLVANPQYDPTGRLRAAGPGGPVPLSGYIPIGMMMNPLTIGFDTLDLHRAAAFEREQDAKIVTIFADLVCDTDIDATLKNQFFFDYIDSYKLSDMGLYGPRDTYAIEDKITATKRVPASRLPDWLTVNTLASLNFRLTHTMVRGGSFYNDYSANRVDAMASTWVASRGGATPNTTFVSSGVNSDLYNDGAPHTSGNECEFYETGLGMLLDMDVFKKLNVVLGGRFDGSGARNRDFAGVFNPTSGTSANPGTVRAVEARAEGWDTGTSWSGSLTYSLPYNSRVYVTAARSSLTLDSAANSISNTVIAAGHIGNAELKEAGFKSSLLKNKLFFTASYYEQSRISVASPTDPTATAEVSSTLGRGWESELKWVPNKSFFLSVYARKQKTIYKVNVGAVIPVHAKALGFQDIVDANGKVIFPAEAFLYGGRAQIVLPNDVPEFNEQQGRPNLQLGFNSSYDFGRGFGVTLSGNYLSSTYSGRLKLIKLPASTIFNVGPYWNVGGWSLRFDVYNVTNERSFRSMKLASGEVLAIANPDRRWQLTARREF